jgi:hypothetical protein
VKLPPRNKLFLLILIQKFFCNNKNRIAGIRDVETMSRIKSRWQQRKRESRESGNDIVDQRRRHRWTSAFTAALLVS